MPICLFPKCFRGRDDSDPIHCIDGIGDQELTEAQIIELDYEPVSFVCTGIAHKPELPQDAYRLCFKNDVTDEMSDNDIQDMSHIANVVTAALALDATRKVNGGTVEVPTMQADTV